MLGEKNKLKSLPMKKDIRENLKRINETIAKTALRIGRKPEEITVVAVTKTVTAHRIKEAIAAGVKVLGENYVQEAKMKIQEIGRGEVQWHLIGHLQTNKAKDAVRLFDCVQSVDSIKVAEALNRQAEAFGKVISCLIEVKLSPEESKFGVAKEDVYPLVMAIGQMRHLTLQGLMTMPPYSDDPESSRPYFATLRKIKEDLQREGIHIKELSMGMSSDFTVAIEEGATMVRLGTAIFGARG